jgi:hypothetical protein
MTSLLLISTFSILAPKAKTEASYVKVVVLIGDAPAHSAPSGLTLGIFSNAYGGDPGRDEVMFTEDDLDYVPVVQKVASEGIRVFTVDYLDYWGYGYVDDTHANFEYIASQTGGKHYYGWTDWHNSIVSDLITFIGTGRGDVVFIVDLTGSMSDNFVDLKTKIKELIDLLPTTLDIGFGLGTFVDYPHYYDSYGYAATYGDAAYGDYAWRMNLDITTDRTLVKNTIDSDIPNIWTYWGGDGPQDYVRALYESQFFSWRVAPKILPVPYFNQGDEPWGSQQYDYTTQTIKDIGCALTCATMILRYYGVEKSPTGETTDPGVLNEWLKANNGYVIGGYIKWPSVAVYSKDANKKFGTPIIKWVGFGSRNDFTMLNNELSNNRPVILQVHDLKYGGHFVVAKGIIGSTYSINDPGWRSRTTLEAYANQFEGMRLYAPTSTDLSAIYIATQSPTQLFLIDSLGRRVGEDPTTGVIYNEIPNSYYFHEALSNLPEITVLAIINPPTDNFTIIAFGYTNEYNISFSGYDRDGNISIQDFHGLIPQYILSYSPEPGSQIHVSQVVKIDVKPGSEPNSINPTNQGVIPVAILTTETFDASTIDSNTVEFGRGKAKPIKTAFEDIDNDGDLDLVLHFRTQQVKIEKEDTQIFLTGKTKDGISIIGWDSIRVVP